MSNTVGDVKLMRPQTPPAPRSPFLAGFFDGLGRPLLPSRLKAFLTIMENLRKRAVGLLCMGLESCLKPEL